MDFDFDTYSTLFLHWQKEILEPHSSAHYTPFWNSPAWLSPLATVLWVAWFICSRTNPDLSLWCPTAFSLCKLSIINQTDTSSSQMLLKGSIKKSKTFQTVAQFSTFLQLFMQMQNDQMVFYMHITLNNFFSLFLSNTLKNIPVIWLAREARKHYSQLWFKKF